MSLIYCFCFFREKYALSMESLLKCPNKEFSDWHEMEQTMNSNLNYLEVKLTSLEKSINECNQDLEQKQKVCYGSIMLILLVALALFLDSLIRRISLLKCFTFHARSMFDQIKLLNFIYMDSVVVFL